MIEEFRRRVLNTFAGLPVFEFNFTDTEPFSDGELPQDVAAWAWRIALGDAEEYKFAQVSEYFMASVDTTRVKALILGYWLEDFDVEIDAAVASGPLIANADRFPALESLFVGDMDSEHSEVSWIIQSDPAPILAAFPRLREFGLRGTTNGSPAAAAS